MNSQEHYWNDLYATKVQVEYLGLLSEHAEWRDRCLKIFLALMSTGSIAAWAVWKQHPLLWGTLIAASQVITAVAPFLPFKARLKSIAGLLPELEVLHINMESKWSEIMQAELTDAEIRRCITTFRQQKQKMLQKNLPGRTLPEKVDLLTKAEKKAELWVETYYG
jgi:hypothetical protein